MTAREPLAALVALCRQLLPIVRGPSASVRLCASDAERLLAAVEAGTKCADALRGFMAMPVITPAEHLELQRATMQETYAPGAAALADWKRVAE